MITEFLVVYLTKKLIN